MENSPFIDYFPIEASIYRGFSMAMLNKQMVSGSVLSFQVLLNLMNLGDRGDPANGSIGANACGSHGALGCPWAGAGARLMWDLPPSFMAGND